MNALFSPLTTTYKTQSNIVKNAYGSSEFPGIAVNGIISTFVDLKLIAVPDRFDPDVSDPTNLSVRRGEICVRYKDPLIKLSYWKISSAAEFDDDGFYHTGDVGELNYSKLDETGRPTLKIVDRVTNMLELYVDGDSVWVEKAKLESQVYNRLSCATPNKICLLADRNQNFIIAVISPSSEFIKDCVHSPGNIKDEERLILQELLAKCEDIDKGYELARRYICSCPSVYAVIIKEMNAAARAAQLRHYEIPREVVLDFDEWTVSNSLLTVTHKPRREQIRAKFQHQMEAIYARHIVGHIVGARDVSSDDGTSRVETADNSELERKAIDMSFRNEEDKIEVLVPLLEKRFTLSQTLGNLLLLLSSLVGPNSLFLKNAAHIDLMPNGYIKQDEASLPCYENSLKKDYITFRFQAVTESDALELNRLLDIMRACNIKIRSKSQEWLKEMHARCTKAAEIANTTLLLTTQETDEHLRLFLCAAEELIVDATEHRVAGIEKAFVALMTSLTRRLLAVRKAYQHCDESAVPCDEEKQCKADYNAASDLLRIRAPRMGVRIPYQIDYGAWFAASADPNALRDMLPEVSLGQLRVWCQLSGELIEDNGKGVGKPRFHALDLDETNQSMSRLLNSVPNSVLAQY